MSTDSYGHQADTTEVSGSVPGADAAPLAGARGRTNYSESRVRSGGRSDSSARRSSRSAPPRGRRKARRVHRVVHHLDIWSLAKVGAIYVACGFVITMISGYILWRAADLAGTIDGIEGFMEDTGGYDTFIMRGDVVFSSALVIGLVLSVLAICMIILAGILFNLISDLTGGIRLTVIDEDLLVTPARRGAVPARAVEPTVAEDPEPEPEPEYEPEIESESEYEPEYASSLEPEPEPVTEYAPEPEAAREPAPETLTGPWNQPDSAPDPEPASAPEPERPTYVPAYQRDPDPEPALPNEPISTQPWTTPPAEPEPDPEPAPSFFADQSRSESEPELEPEAESEPQEPLFTDFRPRADDDSEDEGSDPPKPRFEIDFG